MSNAPVFQSARQGYYTALLHARTLYNPATLYMVAQSTPKSGLPNAYPSNADGDSVASIAIAQAIFDQIQSQAKLGGRLAGQISRSCRDQFEEITRLFLQETFGALKSLRPGKWDFNPETRVFFRSEPCHHLLARALVARNNSELAILLGREYEATPGIFIVRKPEPDGVLNRKQRLVDNTVALRSGIRKRNNASPLLHASIFCNWTLKGDRAQNARAAVRNLICNTEGRRPHIVVVTGEPLPSRVASLVIGTGDINCVYHIALPELIEIVDKLDLEDSANLVRVMVDGGRLKDISDLPLDLAV